MDIVLLFSAFTLGVLTRLMVNCWVVLCFSGAGACLRQLRITAARSLPSKYRIYFQKKANTYAMFHNNKQVKGSIRRVCFSGGLSGASPVFGLALQGALHGLQKSLLREERRGLCQGQVASQSPVQLLLDGMEGGAPIDAFGYNLSCFPARYRVFCRVLAGSLRLRCP